jgi:hypothetical protein
MLYAATAPELDDPGHTLQPHANSLAHVPQPRFPPALPCSTHGPTVLPFAPLPLSLSKSLSLLGGGGGVGFVCVRVHASMRVYVCTCVRVYAAVRVFVLLCACLRARACAFVRACTGVCVRCMRLSRSRACMSACSGSLSMCTCLGALACRVCASVRMLAVNIASFDGQKRELHFLERFLALLICNRSRSASPTTHKPMMLILGLVLCEKPEPY